MREPSYGDRDPIMALATPLGESALALVRTSGGASALDSDCNPGAVDLLAKVFSRPRKLLSAPPNTIVHGWITDSADVSTKSDGGKRKIDEVLVSVYRAPSTYTGEDGADLSCHGGIATVKAVMAALKKAGFREALPGEFTFRAFMNGKLDLTRSESVMELVSSKTDKGREQAVRRLSGALQKEVSAIKALLVKVLAGAEIYLDYSEEEFSGGEEGNAEEEEGRLPDHELAEEAVVRLKTLSELWRRERIYAEGALAVIAGRPNAGKSSLFNYLLKEDRSIVTDTPGTTRDWIEALVSIDDIPLRLADTAGLRDLNQNENGGAEGDEAERIGIQRSRGLLEKADLVLYMVDGERGFTGADRAFIKAHKADKAAPLIVIWNKADIAPPPPLGETEFPGEFLELSAKTGRGVAELTNAVADALLAQSSAGEAVLSESANTAGPGTRRQKDLIDTALSSVREALENADRAEPLDLIAPLLRAAVDALGEITGEVSNEDILEAMFSRFCVGK